MTTAVTVAANCSKETEVLVQTFGPDGVTQSNTLQDGDSQVFYAHGLTGISVKEVLKQEVS